MNNHYRLTCSILSAVALAFCGWQSFANEGQERKGAMIMPSQSVQVGISNFIASIQESSLETEKEFLAAVDDFFSSNESSSKVDLEQMLLMYGGKEEHSTDPQMEMLKRAMLARLVQGMNQEEVLEVIAPHLDETTDAKLLQNMRQALELCLFEKGRPKPDQPGVRKYLSDRKEAPPYGFIKHLYRVGREEALDVVGSVYGGKSASPHAGTGRRGLAAVREVAARGHWWEELYAAEQMWQNPKLRDPELIEQLKKSKHAVVRETVQEIEDEKKERGSEPGR